MKRIGFIVGGLKPGGRRSASPAPHKGPPRYLLDWSQAAGAGFLATAMGMTMGAKSVDLPAVLGAIALPGGGPAAPLIGTLWHYGNGILFTLAYAGVLLALGKQSTVRTGFGFGVALWVAAMLSVPLLMDAHARVRSGGVENPGVFLLRGGTDWTPALFSLLDHLLYGILAGIIYKHSPPQPWREKETLLG